MENMNETQPTIEQEEKENTFTQADVNNVVAKNVKEERAKILKELGIENVEDLGKTKEALKAYRDMQEQQKTDLEKAVEEKSKIEKELFDLKSFVKSAQTQERIRSTLSEMEIDAQYHKAILKLIPDAPEDDKEFKELIISTIKEFLPGVMDKKDVGFEKKEKKIESGSKQYLNEKYKNNPWFVG